MRKVIGNSFYRKLKFEGEPNETGNQRKGHQRF